MQEHTLLALVKREDRAAQKQFYLLYVPLVSSIAFRYLNKRDNVEDVIQNSFIQIFRNIHSFNSNKGTMKSWIAKITVNESIAILRKQKRISFDPLESNETSLLITDNSLFHKLELDDVKKTIGLLKDKHRIILDLFYCEEFNHEEISHLLDISVESSRVRLHRAKSAFNNLWQKITNNEARTIV